MMYFTLTVQFTILQAQQAYKHGAIGIILYSDPADYADSQTENVYPNSVWLPPSGAQRGTILKTSGDPLTPGYPAIGFPLLCH